MKFNRKLLSLVICVFVLSTFRPSVLFAEEYIPDSTEDQTNSDTNDYDENSFDTSVINATANNSRNRKGPEEDNETRETAYSYYSVKTITASISDRSDLYTLGMKTASLEDADDIDWYKVNLNKEPCFMDLRNIGMHNWTITAYHFDASGNMDDKIEPDPVKFDHAPERYVSFTPLYNGTYYVCITNGGDWVDKVNYYFYVGAKQRTFQITNFPTRAEIWLTGSSYNLAFLNLNGVFPNGATAKSLSLTNEFSSKPRCSEVDKRISCDFKNYYYNSRGTGSEDIGVYDHPNLNNTWIIGGKCHYGFTEGCWNPSLNGWFECDMQPYPGNEIK